MLLLLWLWIVLESKFDFLSEPLLRCVSIDLSLEGFECSLLNGMDPFIHVLHLLTLERILSTLNRLPCAIESQLGLMEFPMEDLV